MSCNINCKPSDIKSDEQLRKMDNKRIFNFVEVVAFVLDRHGLGRCLTRKAHSSRADGQQLRGVGSAKARGRRWRSVERHPNRLRSWDPGKSKAA